MHLAQVRKLPEYSLIPQRHEDHAMVSKRAHSRDTGRLLSTAQTGRGYEQAGVFAPEAALLPLAASAVEEGFPLSGKVAVAGGDAEERGVVFLEFGGGDGGDGGVLGWGVHFLEDFVGQGLFHSVGLVEYVCG